MNAREKDAHLDLCRRLATALDERDAARAEVAAVRGKRLEAWAVTPTCRANHGDDGAWEAALVELRKVYDAQVDYDPTVTLSLTIERGDHRDPR